jgi:hypothetical protein
MRMDTSSSTMAVGVISDHFMVSFSFAELFRLYVVDQFIPCDDSSFEKLDNYSTYCV